MYNFEAGDTFGPNECGIWTSGIHDRSAWGNKIEVYGDSQEEAEMLRDFILSCLNVI